MNTLFATRTLKGILGFFFTKLALRNSTTFLSKILNERLSLDLPLLMYQQAESMNILFFASLSARLNEQSLLIITLADDTKMTLTLFLNSLADIFTSLTLVFHLLAEFVHSHPALSTGFDWIVDLVVIAETSRTTGFERMLLTLPQFMLFILQVSYQLVCVAESLQWNVIVNVSLVVLCDFEVIQEVDRTLIERFPQVFLNQNRYVLIILRVLGLKWLKMKIVKIIVTLRDFYFIEAVYHGSLLNCVQLTQSQDFFIDMVEVLILFQLIGQPSQEFIYFFEDFSPFAEQKRLSLIQQAQAPSLQLLSSLQLGKNCNNLCFFIYQSHFLKPCSLQQIDEIQVLLSPFLAIFVIVNIVNILILPENIFYVNSAFIQAPVLNQQLIEFTFEVFLSTVQQKFINILDLISLGNYMYPASFFLVLSDFLVFGLFFLASINALM